MQFLVFFIVVLACWTQPLQSITLRDSTIDVSYDFDQLEGWCDTSADQSQVDIKTQAGALHGVILGSHPTIDSPPFDLYITSFHYIVMRLKYLGAPVTGEVLLASGPIQEKESPWVTRQLPKILTDSGSTSSTHSSSKLLDNNPYTYWELNQIVGAFVIFDLGDDRSVSEIQILTNIEKTSAKHILLQRSITSGVGPFETVVTFTLLNQTGYSTREYQSITGFGGKLSRYWKLVILDNYGANTTQISGLTFLGSDNSIISIPFELNNMNVYDTSYIPLESYFSGILAKMRLTLHYQSSGQFSSQLQTHRSDSITIDYIRIMRSPQIFRVRGCLDQYFDNTNLLDPSYNVLSQIELINQHLAIYSYTKLSITNKQYATTYDCPREGGINITIDGYNFGSNAEVFIGNNLSCPVQKFEISKLDGKLQIITCLLPPLSNNMLSSPLGTTSVRVRNGIQPGLYVDVNYLSYRVPPQTPSPPKISNIGATRVDLTWNVPGSVFEQMAVTGYVIRWWSPTVGPYTMFVSNITQTSVRGLLPNTSYIFTISAMSEGAYPYSAARLPTDLYGRREALSGYIEGNQSLPTNATYTLLHDLDFPYFNVNLTLNHSGSSPLNSAGPTGNYGSEGSYGLYLVGSANIQNCNSSSTCCDGYDSLLGSTSCASSVNVSVCSISSTSTRYGRSVDAVNQRSIITNYGGNMSVIQPSIRMQTFPEFLLMGDSPYPTAICGSAARLTASLPQQVGAMWYRRKMNVAEGFDMYFTFEISNPSQVCSRMDDEHTFCRSRGADGLAFVIQNSSPIALGCGGSGLGYERIVNGLAIELDTFYNYDRLDHYENHISVITRGWRNTLVANHTFSLGTISNIPDLARDPHRIRVKYSLVFSDEDVFHPSFQAHEQSMYFFQNADYSEGSGQGDWGAGVGLLYIYIDDMIDPKLITFLSLSDTLQLDDGRAYIGFTAATGDYMWQTHDILDWQFVSLFEDKAFTPPTIVNGEGAFECISQTTCEHPPDVGHQYRSTISPDIPIDLS